MKIERIIIIPDEDKIKSNQYMEEGNLDSTDEINKFSKLNKLNYHFHTSQSKKAPDTLARIGIMLVEIIDKDTIRVYLPVIVSNNQMKWLNDNKNELKKYNSVGVYNYKRGKDKPENLMSILELVKEAENKNRKYKKGSGSHAR